MMLNVLIVDDEKLVRQMVMRCIDWEGLGFHIIGEASSARMGQEMVEELHPDVICMDVRMPGMSGLECGRLILEKHPYIKIIILSGHDEFEYASEGIKIGVFDYLLKPINAEELKKAAIKVKAAIEEERNQQHELEHFKEELAKNAKYIRDRQLSALVRSRNPQQYLESLSYFGTKIENPVFQVALIDIKTGENVSYEDEILTKMHTRKIVEDFFGDMKQMLVFDSGAEWIILLNNESEDAIYKQGNELKRYLENNTESQVCIGVGNVYQDINKTCESYREAKDAIQYRFISGEEEVIYFRDIYPYYDSDFTSGVNEDAMREFSNAIRIGSEQESWKQLDKMLDYLKNTGKERDQVIILAVEILAEIMKVLTELKVSLKPEQFSYSSMLEGVFSLGTLEEIRFYLKEAVKDACSVIGSEIFDNDKNLTHKVINYLTEHFSDEELSLNFIAKQFYVNASYLSRIFKGKTGKTFTDYLFEVRMKEAERLMSGTELKSYEIAEKVGISDPHYFSACFKRYTGVSVSEYKKK